MFKVCEKCGYMYDHSIGGCPQCNGGEFTAPETNKGTDTDVNGSPNIGMGTNVWQPLNTQHTQTNTKDQYKISLGSINDVFGKFKTKTKSALKDKVLPWAKKHKKALIISLVVMLVLSIAAIVTTTILHNRPITLNVTPEISSDLITDADIKTYYESNGYSEDNYVVELSPFENQDYGTGLIVNGYNKFGYINESNLFNIVDWDDLIDDVNEQLSSRKKVNGNHLNFHDLYSKNSIKIELSEESQKLNKSIKNGDVIEVVYEFVNRSSEIGCETVTGTVSYTVEGLIDVDVFDPFSCVKFVQQGVNSKGSASLQIPEKLDVVVSKKNGIKAVYYDQWTIALKKADTVIGKISFFIEDAESMGKYSNGDSVTAFCSHDDELLDEYQIYISSNSKSYKFTSLGNYVNGSTSLKQDDINMFKKAADKRMNDYFDGMDAYSGIKLKSLYIIDSDEKQSYNNLLYFVYSYNYKYTSFFADDVKNEIRYACVSFEDLVVDTKGKVVGAVESYESNMDTGFKSTESLFEDTIDLKATRTNVKF